MNDVGFEYHLITDVSADDGTVQATAADTSQAEGTSSLGFAVPMGQTRVDTLCIVP